MLDSWDPAVALLVRGTGCLVVFAFLCAVLYTIIKYAVYAGIKLADGDRPGRLGG